VGGRYGFRHLDHVLEITGICDRCFRSRGTEPRRPFHQPAASDGLVALQVTVMKLDVESATVELLFSLVHGYLGVVDEGRAGRDGRAAEGHAPEVGPVFTDLTPVAARRRPRRIHSADDRGPPMDDWVVVKLHFPASGQCEGERGSTGRHLRRHAVPRG